MCGMSVMSGAVAPLKDNELFTGIITEFSNPILGILVGILFTSILQSASAAVGILQALAMTGTIRFDTALSLIMGIAIGAAVPVLLSAIGATTDGKRTALAYLTSNTIGVILGAAVFYGLDAFLRFPFMNKTMTMTTVAALNSIYRFAVVAVLFPLNRQLEMISRWLVRPGSENGIDDLPLKPLEERFLAYPSLAVEQCREAINDMAVKAKENLFLSFDLLHSFSQESYERVQLIENTVDRYEDRLGTYLLKITSRELNNDQNESTGKFLHTITDFERISDHAAILPKLREKSTKKKSSFLRMQSMNCM